MIAISKFKKMVLSVKFGLSVVRDYEVGLAKFIAVCYVLLKFAEKFGTSAVVMVVALPALGIFLYSADIMNAVIDMKIDEINKGVR